MDIIDLLDHLDESEEIVHPIRHFRDRTNPFEGYDDITFKSRYKLSKNGSRDLITLLQDQLETSGRNHAIPPALQADEGKLLIYGGRIVNDDAITNADIFIEGGIIKQIGQKLKIPTTSRTINASGMLVMPGGIDPHVHLKLPTLNINSVDDFYAGTKAALSGGTTMIIDSVTPAKNESLIAAYERYRSWADPNVACDYGLSMVVREFDDRVKLEMSQVVQNKGVNSFKFYMAYVGDLQVTDRQLYQGFLQCKDCGALARVHAEVGDLIHEKQKELISQGITGPEGHIQSRPEEYQTEATSRACLLAKEANCPLYIVHVMSKGAADAIGNARKRGKFGG